MQLDAIIIMGGDKDNSRAEVARSFFEKNKSSERPPLLVATGGSSMYRTPTEETESQRTHDFLLGKVPEAFIIPEDFLRTIIEHGGNPKPYPYFGSCDSYTNLLGAFHKLERLNRSGRIGLASDDDVIDSHVKLAQRMSNNEFVALPNGCYGSRLRKHLATAQTAALIYDMDRSGVQKECLFTHYVMLGKHPALAESFHGKPRGMYATLSKMYGTLHSML